MTDGKETLTPAMRLNSFLARRKNATIFVAALVIVLIVGSVAAYNITQNRSNAATERAEAIQTLYDEWHTLSQSETTDDGAAAKKEDAIRTAIAELVADYPRSYGANRARLILGDIAWEGSDFEAAYEAYITVADDAADTYLGPIALYSAAAAREELADPDGAMQLYSRVVDSDRPNAEAARALFSLGRLAEQSGDIKKALDYYNRLIDDYADSNWTNLGRNRIIWLNSQEG